MESVEQTAAQSRAQRMIRAYMEGAERGMVEIRGYGLTENERLEAGALAARLYGETLLYEHAHAS